MQARGRRAVSGRRVTNLDSPVRMVAQVRVLSDTETAQLIEMGTDEVAGSIPTETVFRAIAKCASEQGDDALARAIEAFLTNRKM